jgi:hypothetical protein
LIRYGGLRKRRCVWTGLSAFIALRHNAGNIWDIAAMKFDLHFHYEFQYVVPPKIKHQSSLAAANVELEIRELTSEQAPVVMRVGNRSGKDSVSANFDAKPDGTPREIRVVDGKYYVEDGTLADLAQSLLDPHTVNASIFGTAKPIRYEKEYDPRRGQWVETKELARVTTLEAIARYTQLREHRNKDDKGEALKAELKMIAEDTLSVDGHLFIRCREPVLGIDQFDKGIKIIPSPAKVDDLDARRSAYTRQGRHYFVSTYASAKTGEDFQAYLKSVGKPLVLPQIEIVDPTWSRFDGTGYTIGTDLNGLQRALQKDMAKLPRDLLEAYYILRDSNVETDVEQFTVSPAIVQAVSLIANYKLPASEEGQSAAMFETWRFARKEHRDHMGELTPQDVKNSLHRMKENFTVNLIKDRGEITGFIKSAKDILRIWQKRSTLDHFDTKASWDMLQRFEDKIVREFNSEGPIYAACSELEVDASPILSAIRQDHRSLTIAHCANAPLAIATIAPDGKVTVHGTGMQSHEVEAAVRHYLENEKDQAMETSINLELATRRV